MRLGTLDTAAESPLAGLRETLLREDFERYDETLVRVLEPQREYLTEIEMDLYRAGKKVRPMMLLLSARALHGTGPVPEKVIQGAVALEMLHVATLIHDDIIDEALVRRGMRSVNAARGIETAIIVGDMQFVQAIRSFVEGIDAQSDIGLVKMVLDVAFRICCGELDELQTDPTSDLAELRSRYLRTIERKTAVMFGLACEAGVKLVGGRTRDARRIGFFGRRIGRAFQMMDDLLDLVQDDEVSGKIRGMDLARRRLSLPLIYAMDELGPDHPVTCILHGADYTDDELDAGVRAVKRTEGFTRTYAEARGEILDGLEYLRPFPRNRYRLALEELALHVVDRGF